MTPHEIDQLRIELEREKWRDEVRLREREVEIKEREQRNREEELSLKSREQQRSRWTNPLVLAVLAAAVAAAGNAFVVWLTAYEQRNADLAKADLAREADGNKSEADRILEVIKINSDPDKAATNLKFLVDAGLILNPKTKDPLVTYLQTRRPGEGVALPSPTTSATTFAPLKPPVFQINCRLPPSASLSDVVNALEDFVKGPPFSFRQIEIVDQGDNRYLAWDLESASDFVHFAPNTLAGNIISMTRLSSRTQSIQAYRGVTGVEVNAILPLINNDQQIDPDSITRDLTARMRKISIEAQCEKPGPPSSRPSANDAPPPPGEVWQNSIQR